MFREPWHAHARVSNVEELYLLRPLELVQPEDNQLVRIAQDEEKLAALRTLFGSTHTVSHP